jgi:hypothetical protein
MVVPYHVLGRGYFAFFLIHGMLVQVTESQIMLVSNTETGQNYSIFGVLLFLGILKKIVFCIFMQL